MSELEKYESFEKLKNSKEEYFDLEKAEKNFFKFQKLIELLKLNKK